MALLNLNEDILLAIIQHLSPYLALQLGLTSRYAYALTIPQRLVEVTIDEPGALLSFCDFCLADKTGRASHIVELMVVGNYIQDDGKFVEVIQHATRLQVLNIGSLEYALCHCPSLRSALLSRTTLTALTLEDNYMDVEGGSLVNDLLHSTIWPITELVINHWQLGTGIDWWTAIASFSATLRVLRLLYIDENMAVHPPPSGLICPGVHTLVAGQYFYFCLEYFSRFLPNVRWLKWHGDPMNFSDLELDDAPGAWPVLDRLTVWNMNYAPLQPSTRIRRMDLPTVSRSDLDYIADFAPVVLTWLDAIPPQEEDLLSLHELLPELRYMRNLQCVPSRTKIFDADVLSTLAADIARDLAAMPLLGICIDFHDKSVCSDWMVHESKAHVPLAKAAAVVASIIRSVQFVGIKIGRNYVDTLQRDDGFHWEVWSKVDDRDGDEVSMRELPWWEGNALESRLLSLSR